MIRYALRCGRGHKFEGWFRNSETFDLQASRGEVLCPHCGVIDIEKDLMAPAVKINSARPQAQAAEQNGALEAGAQMVISNPDKRQTMLIEAMARLRETILSEAEYVGKQFPAEARRLAEDETTNAKPIYGEATLEQLRDLLDDGIKVLPIPSIPKDHN
jgi:hypothetical protein